MAAKYPISFNFANKEEYNLFIKATKKYNLGQSKLARQIISNWLFNNKLQLEDED